MLVEDSASSAADAAVSGRIAASHVLAQQKQQKYAVTGWNRYAWSSTPAFSPSPSFADQRSSAIESRRSGENEEMEKEGKFAGSSGYENMNGGLAKES